MLRQNGWLTLLTLLTLAQMTGCSTVSLESTPPAEFDLTGEWALVSEKGVAPAGRGAFDSGFMAQDFPLLVADTLRIEQDASSMGVEYARGVYRDVSWGERRRGLWEVNAGWHEGELHIYSKTSDASASEIYRLTQGGRMLEVDIQVRMVGRTQHFTRVFERQTGL